MNGSTDIGENPFSENGYNAEAVSMIILGVCGGLATLIYSLKRISECNCSLGKRIFCVESECKQKPEK